MALAAPGDSPWGQPRAAAGRWRRHLGGDTRPRNGHRAGGAGTPALGDCWHWGGPCKEPPSQAQRVPGVSPSQGEQQLQRGGCPEGRAGVARAELAPWEWGWSTPVFSSCSLHLLILHLFSSALPSLLVFSSCYSCHPPPHLIFFLLSSGLPPPSLVFSSPLGFHILLIFLIFPSSWPHHHLPGPFLISALQSLLSTPEVTWGHAVGDHSPFQGKRGSLFPPQLPQHCPELVLMSPGWDRAVPPAQVTVAPPLQPCMSCPASKDQQS